MSIYHHRPYRHGKLALTILPGMFILDEVDPFGFFTGNTIFNRKILKGHVNDDTE